MLYGINCSLWTCLPAFSSSGDREGAGGAGRRRLAGEGQRAGQSYNSSSPDMDNRQSPRGTSIYVEVSVCSCTWTILSNAVHIVLNNKCDYVIPTDGWTVALPGTSSSEPWRGFPRRLRPPVTQASRPQVVDEDSCCHSPPSQPAGQPAQPTLPKERHAASSNEWQANQVKSRLSINILRKAQCTCKLFNYWFMNHLN